MAKSNGFFTLRRGSTKSLTFSVYNGKQITKDRVSSVANPKSQRQQYQRAIMATCMAAYSAMKAIEDHAFQGKGKGSENQREFMSRNLNKMRSELISYFDTNPLITEQKFVSVGPKTPTVLPCAWVISRGSLQNSNFLKYDDSDHTLVIPQWPSSIFYAKNNGVAVKAGDLADALGVYTGLQRTYLTITMDGGTPIYSVYPNVDGAGYANYLFGFARWICGAIDRDHEFTASQSGATGELNCVVDAIVAWTDAKSSPSLRDPETWNNVDPTRKVDAELALLSAAFDESLTFAIGEITSHVDEDLRSNSEMQVRNYADSKLLGLTYDYIWDAWKNSSNALGDSDVYLEGGNV